jgi:hypothetical protein
MNRRIGKPRTATKINGGKGITIDSTDVVFPTFKNRIKFSYDGKEAVLIIIHDYDPASGYFVTADLELEGKVLNDYEYIEQHGNDGWMDYVYSQFRGEFMANRYELKLPRDFVKMIEERLDFMVRAEVA